MDNHCKLMYCIIGIFTGDDSNSNKSMFVCERQPFEDLVQGLTRKCTCGSLCLVMIRYYLSITNNYTLHVYIVVWPCYPCGVFLSVL